MLRENIPGAAKKVPSINLPDFILRLSAWFDPVVRDRLFELGKERPVSSNKAISLLGWQPRPAEQTIVDTANSLIAGQIIKL